MTNFGTCICTNNFDFPGQKHPDGKMGSQQMRNVSNSSSTRGVEVISGTATKLIIFQILLEMLLYIVIHCSEIAIIRPLLRGCFQYVSHSLYIIPEFILTMRTPL